MSDVMSDACPNTREEISGRSKSRARNTAARVSASAYICAGDSHTKAIYRARPPMASMTHLGSPFIAACADNGVSS